jgi:RNA polymerase sigma factor (sigma-70 family)
MSTASEWNDLLSRARQGDSEAMGLLLETYRAQLQGLAERRLGRRVAQRVAEKLDARHSTPSQRAMRAEDLERLTRALATLPEDQREAVRLRHLEGWALAAIAEHLGRSPAATAGLVKRGMKALRSQMRQEDAP